MTIICKEHGAFTKKPSKHLTLKHSCPKCAKLGYSNAIRMSRDEFLRRATNLHGVKYDYSKVTIQKKDDPIEIYCKKHHHSFKQRLNVHLDGREGCKHCNKENKEDSAHQLFQAKFIDFFRKKFGTHYSFSKVNYINNTTPVVVKCLKHDYEFEQVHRNAVRYNTCSCKYCKSEHLRNK